MKITIDYDPKNNNFAVLVDRGALSNGNWPWPPPPPSNEEFAEITSWLSDVYKTSLKKFEADSMLGAVRFLYEPKAGIQGGFQFKAEKITPPNPPPFINK